MPYRLAIPQELVVMRHDQALCLIRTFYSRTTRVYDPRGSIQSKRPTVLYDRLMLPVHRFVRVDCNNGMELIALRASFHQWRLAGSNRRPPACKAGALPTELSPLKQRPQTIVRPRTVILMTFSWVVI